MANRKSANSAPNQVPGSSRHKEHALCTGTMPRSADLNLRSGSIETVVSPLYQLAISIRIGYKELTLRRVLVNVRRNGFARDDVLRDAVLVDAHRREDRERPGVDLGAAVRDDAHDDWCGGERFPNGSARAGGGRRWAKTHTLFPAVGAPDLAAVPLAQVLNVLCRRDHRISAHQPSGSSRATTHS